MRQEIEECMTEKAAGPIFFPSQEFIVKSFCCYKAVT
jgi:hypothetical protein